jgi:uncharacterized Zn ribbon protein
MPRVLEQEVYCPECGRTVEIPECHGKPMEYDGSVFFCPACAREWSPPSCCGGDMRIRRKVRDIRKEIFRAL